VANIPLKNLGSAVKPENWPFPFKFTRPFVRHNIWGDTENQPKLLPKVCAYMGYISCPLLTIVVWLNWIACWIVIFSPIAESPYGIQDFTQRIKMIVMSAIFLCVVPPAHFLMGYWPLYQAMCKLRFTNFLYFFVSYLLPILFCLFGFSGYYEYGATGLVTFVIYFPPFGSLVGCITSLVMMFVWAIMGFYFLANYILVVCVFVMKYFYIVQFIMAKLGIDKCIESIRRKEEDKKKIAEEKKK